MTCQLLFLFAAGDTPRNKKEVARGNEHVAGKYVQTACPVARDATQTMHNRQRLDTVSRAETITNQMQLIFRHSQLCLGF